MCVYYLVPHLTALADDAWRAGDREHERYYGVMFGLETAREELARIVADMMRESADLPRSTPPAV